MMNGRFQGGVCSTGVIHTQSQIIPNSRSQTNSHNHPRIEGHHRQYQHCRRNRFKHSHKAGGSDGRTATGMNQHPSASQRERFVDDRQGKHGSQGK